MVLTNSCGNSGDDVGGCEYNVGSAEDMNGDAGREDDRKGEVRGLE